MKSLDQRLIENLVLGSHEDFRDRLKGEVRDWLAHAHAAYVMKLIKEGQPHLIAEESVREFILFITEGFPTQTNKRE